MIFTAHQHKKGETSQTRLYKLLIFFVGKWNEKVVFKLCTQNPTCLGAPLNYELMRVLGSGGIDISLIINYDCWVLVQKVEHRKQTLLFSNIFIASALYCRPLEISGDINDKLYIISAIFLVLSFLSNFQIFCSIFLPISHLFYTYTSPKAHLIHYMPPCSSFLSFVCLRWLTHYCCFWTKTKPTCLFTITALPRHPFFHSFFFFHVSCFLPCTRKSSSTHIWPDDQKMVGMASPCTTNKNLDPKVYSTLNKNTWYIASFGVKSQNKLKPAM